MGNGEKNRIVVTIMGEEYVLRGSSSVDEMRQAGQYVDQLMRTLSEKNVQMNRHKIAVLAALNIADELFRLKGDLTAESSKSQGESDWTNRNELA